MDDFSPYQEICLQLPYDFRTILESVPTRKNLQTQTQTQPLPPFRVHGYNWTFVCCEGPAPGSADFISIQMKLVEPTPLPSKLRGKFIFEVKHLPESKKVLLAGTMTVEKVWGLEKFISKQAVQQFAQHYCCVDGRIELLIKVSISVIHLKPKLFQPALLQRGGGGQILLNEILSHGTLQTRKVSFVVATTEEVCTMHLPWTLMQQRLPQLVSLLNSDDDNDPSNDATAKCTEAVSIEGLIETMTLDSFQLFLSIAFTGINTALKEEIGQHSLKLLDLADRFGFVELKLYMEGHLAEYHMVDVEWALYLLAISHSRNCALLKECCMDYLNSPLIFPFAVESSQWAEVVEAAPDLQRDMYRRLGLTQAHAPSPPRTMSALYKELERRGLDLEGARRQLEDRLTNSSSVL